MKLNMAIIGPHVLVRDILEVTGRFEEVETFPLVYDSELDAPRLIAECKENIDLYLFSGPAPYYLSQKVIPSSAKSFYIPFEGSDLYSVLLRIYQSFHFFPVVSYDVIHGDHLLEVYNELEMGKVPWFVKQMEGDWDSEELYNHHVQLWKDREVQVIATCLHSVYERLHLLKMPVFLIRHTKQNIRETVRRAILTGLEQRKAEAQITVLQFWVQGAKSTEQEATEDRLKQKITDFANTLLSGTSVVQEDRITVYTTRGLLDKVTKQGTDLSILSDLRNLSSRLVYLGIGVGETADSAAYNADRALQFAVVHGDSCGFLIDEEKRVHGPLGTEQSLHYSLIHKDEGNFVSVSLRKFYAWFSMMKKERVTAREVSIGMNTSDRHAARILKMLCDRNLATVVGKESMNHKGRPRPIYEINMAQLAEEV